VTETSSKEKVEKSLKDERELIRKVFNNEDGHKLLQIWAANHIWSQQIHPDPNILYMRIGQQEIITNILNCLGEAE